MHYIVKRDILQKTVISKYDILQILLKLFRCKYTNNNPNAPESSVLDIFC